MRDDVKDILERFKLLPEIIGADIYLQVVLPSTLSMVCLKLAKTNLGFTVLPIENGWQICIPFASKINK